MENLEKKYRLLTWQEIENLSLELRVCFFLQPWNYGAKIKNVNDWIEIFWIFEAIEISEEKYFQGLYNENIKEGAKESLRNKHKKLCDWVSELIAYYQ